MKNVNPEKLLDAAFRLSMIGLFAVAVKLLIDKAEEDFASSVLERIKTADPKLLGEAALWLIGLGVIASVGHNLWDRQDSMRLNVGGVKL